MTYLDYVTVSMNALKNIGFSVIDVFYLDTHGHRCRVVERTYFKPNALFNRNIVKQPS